MNTRSRILATAAVALATTGFVGTGLAGAAPATSTVEGKITKFVTMDNFDVKAMNTTWLVKTNDMTRITENTMSIKVGKLKKGWLLSIKGTEGAMHTIKAASIIVETM